MFLKKIILVLFFAFNSSLLMAQSAGGITSSQVVVDSQKTASFFETRHSLMPASAVEPSVVTTFTPASNSVQDGSVQVLEPITSSNVVQAPVLSAQNNWGGTEIQTEFSAVDNVLNNSAVGIEQNSNSNMVYNAVPYGLPSGMVGEAVTSPNTTLPSPVLPQTQFGFQGQPVQGQGQGGTLNNISQMPVGTNYSSFYNSSYQGPALKEGYPVDMNSHLSQDVSSDANVQFFPYVNNAPVSSGVNNSFDGPYTPRSGFETFVSEPPIVLKRPEKKANVDRLEEEQFTAASRNAIVLEEMAQGPMPSNLVLRPKEEELVVAPVKKEVVKETTREASAKAEPELLLANNYIEVADVVGPKAHIASYEKIENANSGIAFYLNKYPLAVELEPFIDYEYIPEKGWFYRVYFLGDNNQLRLLCSEMNALGDWCNVIK